MPVHEINALVITPGGLNPPGKTLNVVTLVELGYKDAKGKRRVDENHWAESECLRIIDNFRKAGLPSEFTELCVRADLPAGGGLERSGNSVNLQTIFCAYVIKREELMNGSPPRQTIKDLKILKP